MTGDPIVAAEPEADLARSGARLVALQPHVRALLGHTPAELAVTIEDPARPLDERHAAGLVLGLIGDPRIDPDSPAMCDVAGAEVPIGLDPARLDAVVAEWAALGVQRDWIAKEVPRHRVRIAAFRIARYPVTNGEYLRYVLDDPTAERPTCWAHGVYGDREAAFAAIVAGLPAAARPAERPFGDPVPAAATAAPIEQLVAWYGRRP